MAKDTITIAGHQFTVDSPYAEGHELSANEASAMNQLRHENLRNNFAKRVKDHVDAGGSAADLQAEFDGKAAEYEFGARSGGGGSRDPVMTEAMSMARDIIKRALKQAGQSAKAEQITEAAKRFLASPNGQKVMDEARSRVEAQKTIAQGSLDDLLAGISGEQKAA